MSLIGNLEDLELGEILQIINLSRKTGILTVRSEGRKAILCFHNGQIVQAMSTIFHRGVGELLIRRGIVDEMTLQKAVEAALKSETKTFIGAMLVRHFGVSQKIIEEAVREQIERVIFSLFSWKVGTFEFEQRATIDMSDDLHLDPVEFMIRQGMNPQMLRPEIYPRSPEEVSPVIPALPALDSSSGNTQPRVEVIVVDDDAQCRETIAEALKSAGYEPLVYGRSEDALMQIDSLYGHGRRPHLVIDLIMPRMDGSGILGGIELTEIVHAGFPDLAVLVLSDYHNNEAEKKVTSVGCSFMLKPRKAEYEDKDIVDYFVQHLMSELSAFDQRQTAARASEHINIGDELRKEMGETPSTQPHPPTAGLTLLRGMLEELHEPALGGGVILLALRFASEFMNRAVVFMVDDANIFALGQFGVTANNVMTAGFVRELLIPRHEPTIFTPLFSDLKPIRLKPDSEGWNQFLFEKLGGVPAEVFLAPILSEDTVVAILYGDNFPETTPIADTDALEIFLSQAGVAMEKALLKQRLRDVVRR